MFGLGAVIGCVSSAFSTVCGAIGGLVGSVSSALGAAFTLLKEISPELVELVIRVIEVVAKILDIVGVDDKTEELGLKASLSEKKLEDFDSTKEYINHLKTINLSEDDLKKLEDPQKLMDYKIIGTGIQMEAINEHYNMDIPLSTYVNMAKMGILGSDVKTILDTFQEKKVEPKLEEAIQSELPLFESEKIIGTLKEGIEKLGDSETVNSKLDEMLDEM